MVTKVVLDTLNKTAKQGKMGKISKQVGDSVKIGEKILQVESVKGNTIVKSKLNGVVKEIIATEGSKVKIGDASLEKSPFELSHCQAVTSKISVCSDSSIKVTSLPTQAGVLEN